MDNSKKLIADFPVNAAEFFTAITHAATELYISMHVLDLEDKTVFPIKSNEFIDKFMNCDFPLQESLTNIMVTLHVQKVLPLSRISRPFQRCRNA